MATMVNLGGSVHVGYVDKFLWKTLKELCVEGLPPNKSSNA